MAGKTQSGRRLLIAVTLVNLAWLTISPATARLDRKEDAGSPCSSWLEATLKSVETVSMLRRRDRIIRALGISTCKAIPDSLRKAAAAGFQTKGRLDRSALAEASRAVLGPACQVGTSATSAWEAVATCPLAIPEFKIAEGALKDMSVTDYLVLNAIQKSLLIGREYHQTAELVLRNFSLSAALLGEQARERKQRGRVF